MKKANETKQKKKLKEKAKRERTRKQARQVKKPSSIGNLGHRHRLLHFRFKQVKGF